MQTAVPLKLRNDVWFHDEVLSREEGHALGQHLLWRLRRGCRRLGTLVDVLILLIVSVVFVLSILVVI